MDEHHAFLEWLLHTIEEQSIGLLLVVGDVFDNASPNHTSQKMYYDFLLRVRNSGCKNVIIVGGNHDSPSFLNAPKEILSILNVYVVGNATENIEDEVIVIKDSKGGESAIVCAVPFLRERDISRFAGGESYTDRSKRINESIKNHYAAVAEIAQNELKKSGKTIPVIATGHLSVAGGKTTTNDGVRETYIGNIECIDRNLFPQTFDYVALGHYHIPSVIRENLRYCGSPIPMGFNESNQQKCVYIVNFKENKPEITTLEIPVFQHLDSIRGDMQFIHERLLQIKKSDHSIWVEIIYEGNEIFPDLVSWVNERVAHTKIEVINLINRQYINEVLTKNDSALSLEELDRFIVFDKLLDKNGISDDQKTELTNCYREIVADLSFGE